MDTCVAVFCGASPSGVRQDFYLEMARAFGRQLSELGFHHANGGTSGMMPELAIGGASAGGVIHGVALAKYAKPIPEYTTYKTFDLLRDRQGELIRLGHAFVALPGGIGTVYEVCDVVCHMAIEQLARAPMICVGEEDHAAIEVMLHDVMERGFGYTDVRELVSFVPNIDRALELLVQHRASRG